MAIAIIKMWSLAGFLFAKAWWVAVFLKALRTPIGAQSIHRHFLHTHTDKFCIWLNQQRRHGPLLNHGIKYRYRIVLDFVHLIIFDSKIDFGATTHIRRESSVGNSSLKYKAFQDSYSSPLNASKKILPLVHKFANHCSVFLKNHQIKIRSINSAICSFRLDLDGDLLPIGP